MMKKISKILLAILLVVSVSTINIAAETADDTLHISTIKQWNKLAEDCSLDSYSKNLKVVLDKDLEFDDDNFDSIPYFQGSFDGQGHKLKGIKLQREEKISGVFRITGKDAVIENLTVDYSVDTDSESIGFVGYNQGHIENIKVTIDGAGTDEIGAVVGYNSTNGEIIKCTSNGKLYGDHYAGGIVGINYGLVEECKNNTVVNNRVIDDNFDIKSLTVDAITNSESLATVTDFGGIVGQNYGTIRTSTNNALIGYEHVGYNAGGIAGSSLGCIEDCTNSATVYGRKDVGGIVGQAEPAMQIAMNGGYLGEMRSQITLLSETLQTTINHSADFGDENSDSLYKISDDLREAYDSIDNMLQEGYVLEDGTISHTAKYYEYKTTLTSSMTDVFDTMDALANSSSDSSNALRDDFTNIDNQLRDFGYLAVDFADSIVNPSDMYQDVSDNDNDSLKEGKIISCTNNGYISGDISVGGIAGTIAVENNLDPEDEFTIVGQTSTNGTYKIKAVINKCINNGTVNILRNNAGGIVGQQDLGLIKNCINYGLLDCSDGEYVGGIAGLSIATIKNSYSKCFVKGNNYVGGIAGSGTKLNNNGSLAQIVESTTNVGSILGNYGNVADELVENASDIYNNWYVYELPAIDGISYANKAYQITTEEMLAKDIDEELKKVNVYFYVDDELVYKYSMNYGDSMPLDKVPTPDEKEADYGLWQDFDENNLNNVEKDLLFIAEYNNIYPSISSDEDPMAYVVADGSFSKTDTLILEDTDDKPSAAATYKTVKPVFTLSEYSSITDLRLYAYGYSNYDVYEYCDEKWQKVDYTIDGSYAVVEYNPNSTEYSIVKESQLTVYIEYAAIASAVLILGVILFKQIKAKKKNK